jgi:hypothetical protein
MKPRRSTALFGFPLVARRQQIARSHWGRKARKRAAQLIPLKGKA